MSDNMSLDYEHSAGQIAAALSATIHIAPVWRQNITKETMRELIRQWGKVIESESDDMKVISQVVNDLIRLSADFGTAWQRLTAPQQTSCSNAIRNILFECRAKKH